MDSYTKEIVRRKAYAQRRKEQMKNSDLKPAMIREMKSNTHYCKYCGTKLVEYGDTYRTKSLDHIIPLTRGGTHTKINVQIICWLCNNRKRNLFESEFLEHYFPQKDVKVVSIVRKH